MTSTVVAAAAHQIPPIYLPQVPRVRPPRLLPGSISPNTLPQPPGPIPDGQVWVQGKWRNKASNAAKQHQHVISQRVKRALKHHHQGHSIFAYQHIKSHQVVYSLTRNMESGQIMPQLVFHGKKTVPAALRRDSWRPYFSVHFPETPAGARVGLKAYRRLREFALSRQLQPPKDYLVATEQDQRRAKAKVGDPTDVREQMEKGSLKLPVAGHKLSKKLRGEKLMNQGATSVADLAFTLQLAKKALPKVEEKVPFLTPEVRDSHRREQLGPRRWMKLRQMRRAEEAQRKVIAERQALVDTVNWREGQMPLDRKVATQLSIEYDGAVAGSNRVINKADIEVTKERAPDKSHDIQVLWADIRDGTYAQTWPQGVFHGELQPVVTSQRTQMQVRQPETIDEDGVKIEQQSAPRTFVTGSSPHIIGREKGYGYRPFQDVLRDDAERRRAERKTKEDSQMDYFAGRDLARLRQKRKLQKSVEDFEQLVLNRTFIDLAQKESNEEYLNPTERSTLVEFQTKQADLLAALGPLRQLEVQHPKIASEADMRECWDKRFVRRGQTADELEESENRFETRRRESVTRIDTLEAKIQSLVQGYAAVEGESIPAEVRDQLAHYRAEIDKVEDDLRSLEEETNDVDMMFFDHEKETERIDKELLQDEVLRSETSLLKSAIADRAATIKDLRTQTEEQKKETTTRAERATQIAGPATGTADAPIDAADPFESPQPELDILTKELKDLRTAQDNDQTKLKQLEEQAYQTFVAKNPSLDINTLLPRAYRDEIYWAGSEFVEQVRGEVPSTEEIELDAGMEEKKGLVQRMREKMPWFLGGARS